jgi:hypothetical protein
MRDVKKDLELTESQVKYRLFMLYVHGYLNKDISERKKARYWIQEDEKHE